MLSRFKVSAHSKNLCCRYDAACWNASRAKAEAPIWAERHNCAGDKSKINATLHSKMQINLFQLSSKRRLGFSGLNNSCSCEERIFFLWAYLKPRTSSEQVIHSPQFKAVPYLLVWEKKSQILQGIWTRAFIFLFQHANSCSSPDARMKVEFNSAVTNALCFID